VRRAGRGQVDVTDLTEVLGVDAEAHPPRVRAEAMVTMEQLVAATLPHGLVPKVLPPFKGVTVGGAAMGAALGSSSHRWGLFLDSCISVSVLLGDGRVQHCTRVVPISPSPGAGAGAGAGAGVGADALLRVAALAQDEPGDSVGREVLSALSGSFGSLAVLLVADIEVTAMVPPLPSPSSRSRRQIVTRGARRGSASARSQLSAYDFRYTVTPTARLRHLRRRLTVAKDESRRYFLMVSFFRRHVILSMAHMELPIVPMAPPASSWPRFCPSSPALDATPPLRCSRRARGLREESDRTSSMRRHR